MVFLISKDFKFSQHEMAVINLKNSEAEHYKPTLILSISYTTNKEKKANNRWTVDEQTWNTLAIVQQIFCDEIQRGSINVSHFDLYCVSNGESSVEGKINTWNCIAGKPWLLFKYSMAASFPLIFVATLEKFVETRTRTKKQTTIHTFCNEGALLIMSRKAKTLSGDSWWFYSICESRTK